jgi:hypothetical protein
MSPIAIFWHTVFILGEPPEPSPHAITIVSSQMEVIQSSGLLDIASEMYVGINGDEESQVFADGIIPEKAIKVYHGTQCKNELRTIMLMQEVMRGRTGWYVLYGHAKGASHTLTDELSYNWRWCMLHHLVQNWDVCISSLRGGVDMAGCHWKTGMVDGTQSLFAGNCWWAKSEFLNTLPPIEDNLRIPLMGGIDAFASRYEAEVWIGTGKRLPKVRDYHPTGPFTCGR